MTRNRSGVFVFMFLSMIFISCEKVQEDKIPPLIFLQGNNPDSVLVGCSYQEPGAVTIDDEHGHDYRVSGEVNSDSAGTYYLDYIAYDADSNFAFEQRKVIVRELNGDYFTGNFQVFDTLVVIPREISQYPVSVDSVSPDQNLFRMSNFNNFGNAFQVLFSPDSTGTFQLNYDLSDTIVQGQGFVNCSASGFRISYTVETPDGFQTHKATFKNIF